MKKLYPLLSVLFLIYWGCEEEQEEDTTPPIVSISSHSSGQSVNEIVTIIVTTQDNEGISKVEFFIDDSLVLTDTESPYQYDWNTTQYEDNSEHIVKVVSYDNSDNSTESQPILLRVDNSTSTPNGGNITSVTYTLTEMTVKWEETTDGDFKDYKVLYSDTENGVKDTLTTYTDISTTSYTITEFDPLIENWFWVQVTDTLGLSSIGTGMTNSLDLEPNPVNVTSVTYDLESMTITWEEYVPNMGRIQLMNQNTRSTVTNDFVSYELLQSDSEDGTYTSVVVITDQSITSHSITEYDPTQENWFKVKVTDFWGLNSTGSGMTNEINNPPIQPELYSIVYENDSFTITWSQNNDDDFQSYKLYESLSEDMSNDTLIYETDNRTDTTFIKIVQNFRFYQIVVEDVWGLQSTSNIEVGDYDVGLWGVYYSVLNTTYLVLNNNELTGEIPSEIWNLTNLTWLDLGSNQLTGSIPSEIGNLTNLEMLSLSFNQLTGSIPPEVGNLTNLTGLYLNRNQLIGSIPSEIGNLTNLEGLYLYDNQLTGSIPPEIGNLTNLTWLGLYNNQLMGEIPESICDLNIDWSNSNSFNITNNQLCPPYPSCIEEYVGEQNLSNCEGFVELWGESYSIENTTELNLSENGLTGTIPPEIGNLTNLTYLDLRVNQLTGPIPPEIGNLTNLEWLDLTGNQLTGSIPPEIGYLANLERLYLWVNQLTGSIPSEIGNLINLTHLYLSNNQLTGEIPSEIGNLTNLNHLGLYNNQLTGIIPDEICNQGDSSPGLENNQLCPPYPSCIEDYVGEQDTSDCP